MPLDYYQLFVDIVKQAFLGGTFILEDTSYNLPPTLLRKYDFLSKSFRKPGTEIGRLFANLPDEFRVNAKSQLYRTEGGWVDKGIKNGQLQEVTIGKESFLIPQLSKPAVGIDTSSNTDLTFLCIACLNNYRATYVYLEKHLGIPKAHDPIEFKWSRLNSTYKDIILQNFDLILHMSCKALLMIKTNALRNRLEKANDVFIKLIDGCFSGFESRLGKQRQLLREKFFNLCNDTATHCDADFSPLSTDKIVRHLVMTLAKGRDCTPLHVEKLSHESEPIQVTDILCGALRDSIEKSNNKWLEPLPFNSLLVGRRKKGKEMKFAKCYYWPKLE